MDILNRLFDMQTLQMEAYKDFREMARQLMDERGAGANLAEEDESPADYTMEFDEYDVPMAVSMSHNYAQEYAEDDCDFPLQNGFCIDDINPEDPAFWGGKSIGLPVAVVVRSNDGQDKLIPIKDGMYTDHGI